MRNLKIIAVALVLLATAFVGATLNITTARFAGTPAPVSNVQNGYQYVNSVTADDTYLASTTKYWDNIDGSSPDFFPVPPSWTNVTLTFYGCGDAGDRVGDPNGTTFSYQVYAVRKYGGAIVVYTGTGAMGTARLGNNPYTGADFPDSTGDDPNYTWCDTLATTTDDWIYTVILAGEGATNNIATTTIPWDGSWGLWVAIKDMTGQAVFEITCIVTGH